MKKTPQEWAEYNLREYDRCLSIWQESIHSRSGPNYNALLGAYKHLYGAEINFLDAKNSRGARDSAEERQRFAKIIEKIMQCCSPKAATFIYHRVMEER